MPGFLTLGSDMAKSPVHGSESARPSRATYQDVLDAPAHRVAEIVDGTLYISPRPPTLQALAKTRLSAGLGHAFCSGRGGPGGWWIMHEPELHLGEDILVPDVAGWRRERLPRIPETWDEAFELHDGQWLLIASAKDDEPVSIRPFDAITFNLGDLWAGVASAQRPA